MGKKGMTPEQKAVSDSIIREAVRRQELPPFPRGPGHLVDDDYMPGEDPSWPNSDDQPGYRD